jgi:hypothetical protein
MKFEISRRSPKRGKKRKKLGFVSWKAYFFSYYFSLLLFFYTSKMISKA